MGRWLLCLMLLWPASAGAEDWSAHAYPEPKWRANIRELCGRDWSPFQHRCIKLQKEIAAFFAHAYLDAEQYDYRHLGRFETEVYFECFVEGTEDGLTDWFQVLRCFSSELSPN